MPPVSKGEGRTQEKWGSWCVAPLVTPTLLLLQGIILVLVLVLVLILLHSVASILHQPAHSPLCPQCPELSPPAPQVPMP